MAFLVDSMTVGGPILPQSHFADGGAGFYDDFSDGLSINTIALPGRTDGRWKQGLYSDGISTSGGLTWGSDRDFGPGQLNRERVRYCSPNYPMPNGELPYEIVNGNLVITSRPVDKTNEEEVLASRIKGYAVRDDGQLGPFLDDGSLHADYFSGMLSTIGRFAMSYGRTMQRAKMPAGIIGAEKRTERRAIFPAPGWDLREIMFGKNQNGEPLPDPHRCNQPGNLFPQSGHTEIDWNEAFGESFRWFHQTLHRNAPTFRQTSARIDTGVDFRTTFIEPGVDRIPDPRGGGKVGFHLNGKYTSIVPMPPEMREPLPIYAQVPGKQYLLQMHDGREPQQLSNAERSTVPHKVVGRRSHADGSDEHMRFFTLCNIARDGHYPLSLARDVATNTSFSDYPGPPHSETCSLEVEYFGMFPLLDDNPDRYGVSVNGEPRGTGSSVSPDEVPNRAPGIAA